MTFTGPNAQNPAPEDNLLGLVDWQSGTGKPALVYFFWSNTSDPQGRDTRMLDANVFDTEDVARASKHFACYKVDAFQEKPEELLKRGISPGNVPVILLADAQGRTKIILPRPKTNVSSVKLLENCLGKMFPEYWKQVQQNHDTVRKIFEEGRKAYEQKRLEEARDKMLSVIKHPTRTSWIERAEEVLSVVETKLDNLRRQGKF